MRFEIADLKSMNNYKELIVWQKSMVLVELVYQYTASFPDGERFGLINQIRRSAISVPSNIAEGGGRNSKNEFRNFLGIANGSLNELSTPLEISRRLGLILSEEYKKAEELINEIQKMIYSLINKFSNI